MSEGDYQWYAVRAQPKRERIAAKSLRESLELEVVCPIVKYRKMTRRGPVWWSEAMFPGYLFVRFDRMKHERAVCYAQGVLTVLKFGEYLPPIDAGFVSALADQLGGEDEITISHSVELGDQLEIAEGPLSGQVGDVVEVLPGKDRVRLLVDFIGGEQELVVDLLSLLLPGRPDEK